MYVVYLNRRTGQYHVVNTNTKHIICECESKIEAEETARYLRG